MNRFKFASLAVWLFTSSVSIQGQSFELPLASDLMANRVERIVVYDHQLSSIQGWITAEEDTFGSASIDSTLTHTIFVNQFGYVDSIYLGIIVDHGVQPKLLVEYDSIDRVIGLKEVLSHRPNYRNRQISPNDSGWTYRQFEDGKLHRLTYCTPDSIILFDSAMVGNRTNVYRYNPATEVFRTWVYIDGTLGAKTFFQWEMKNGMPDSVVIRHEYLDKRVPRLMKFKKPGIYEARHKVHETGAVLGFPESVFSQGLAGTQFSERHNRHPGIYFRYNDLLVAKTLIKRSPTSYLHNFDGLTQRSYYSFKYFHH